MSSSSVLFESHVGQIPLVFERGAREADVELTRAVLRAPSAANSHGNSTVWLRAAPGRLEHRFDAIVKDAALGHFDARAPRGHRLPRTPRKAVVQSTPAKAQA